MEHINNPGLRLYERGLQLHKEKEKNNENARKEREMKELQDFCTFQP